MKTEVKKPTLAERRREHKKEYFALMKEATKRGVELTDIRDVLRAFELEPKIELKKLVLKFIIENNITVYYIPLLNRVFIDFKELDNLALANRKERK